MGELASSAGTAGTAGTDGTAAGAGAVAVAVAESSGAGGGVEASDGAFGLGVRLDNVPITGANRLMSSAFSGGAPGLLVT